MNTFQIVVIVVAAVILIGSLTWFGITIRKSKTAGVGAFPPIFSDCPDYWEKTDTGECIVPSLRNTPTIRPGLTTTPLMQNGEITYADSGYTPGYTPEMDAQPGGIIGGRVNFSAPEWTTYGLRKGNISEECVYREWANRVGVVWDGITNYNQCD